MSFFFQKKIPGIFLCLSLFTCKPLKKAPVSTSTIAPQKLRIESIVCNNLSENLAGVGTLNDEVLLFIYQKNQGSLHELVGQSLLLTIDEEEEHLDIQLSLPLSGVTNASELNLVLIELDTERTSEAIANILTQALNEKGASSEKIKKAIEDDDLLGIKRIDLKERKKSQTISFWGMQFFDEYAYEVKCRLDN